MMATIIVHDRFDNLKEWVRRWKASKIEDINLYLFKIFYYDKT